MKRVRNSAATTFLPAVSLSILSVALYADEKPHSMNEGFNIPAEEFSRFEHDALLGSGDDAYKLSQYHYFVSLNEQDGFRWLQVAAEDGNATAAYSLGARLRDGDGPQDKLRACFWLKQAQAHGAGDVVARAKRQLTALGNACAGK
jgi:TPR repeat protein